MKPVVVIIVLLVLGALVFGAYKLFHKTPAPPVVPVVEIPGAKYKVLGTSVNGLKIESYTYGDGEHHLVFMGGIHGGYEWNTISLIYKLLDYLDANPNAVPDNVKVTVIPNANPDGTFRVTKKVGRFTIADVSKDAAVLRSGRFNAHEVDLNRNFDCNWKPESMWQSRTVSAGTAPFSEPEAAAFRKFILVNTPDIVVSWHSQGNAVYGSECNDGVLPATKTIMNTFSKASGYPASESYTAYEITGDADGWLASIKIPAITVELKTHETIEWEMNLTGIKALFEYYKNKKD